MYLKDFKTYPRCFYSFFQDLKKQAYNGIDYTLQLKRENKASSSFTVFW